VKRRISFATPFVFVVGCKHPVETTREPDPPVRVSAPSDARIRDVVVDASTTWYAEVCSTPGANCNPPKPTPDAPPEPMLEARVLMGKAGKGAQRSIVTIGIGSRDGVLPSWKGEVFYGVARLGTFTILKLEEGKTIGYSDADPELLSPRCHVKFTPPETQ